MNELTGIPPLLPPSSASYFSGIGLQQMQSMVQHLPFAKREQMSPVDSLFGVVHSSSSSGNKYKELNLLIHELTPKGLLSEELMQDLYQAIEQQFRLVEHLDTDATWIQRGDLLDAVDLLVDLSSGKLSPMRARPSSAEIQPQDGEVLLVPYRNMKEAVQKTAKVKSDTIVCSEADFKENLGPLVEVEYSRAASTVKKLTARDHRLEMFMSRVYRLLTVLIGRYQNNEFSKSSLSLALMSRKLGISSSESFTKKTEEGRVRYHRGPRFLFGKSVHDYGSRNEWFKRDLTQAARSEYLLGVDGKEAKLTLKYGVSLTDIGEPISRLVVANSDSRVRYHALEAAKFGVQQELTGKVLSDESVTQAKQHRDDPLYYKEKYKFTTKNLMGRKNEDPMTRSDPRLVIQQKSEQKQREIEKLNQLLTPLSRADHPSKAKEKKMEKIRSRLLHLTQEVQKLNQSPELFIAAQHELLGGLWRLFNRQGATQIIQRLAPADIHNYVAPLNGKPLSHKEACETLQRQMQMRLEALSGSQEEEKLELEAEIAHFRELIAIFNRQEDVLGRNSQATIDIHGTNESVSTPAISNKSSILAQNDRKIMMFLHEDGSFSMHVFIGATGVNKVDVEQQTEAKMKRGDRQGDMQFGSDKIEAKGSFKKTTDNITVDSHRKLRLGEWKGGFPLNGSTVISYYLPNDFSVLPKMKTYKDAISYGEGVGRKEIELKVNMGDPLLVKTEILYAQVVERYLSFSPATSVEEIKANIKKADLSYRPNDLTETQSRYFQHDQEILGKLQELLKKTELSFEEHEALTKFERTIEQRLARLKANEPIANEMDLSAKELELGIETIEEMLSSSIQKSSSLTSRDSQRITELEEQGDENWLMSFIMRAILGKTVS